MSQSSELQILLQEGSFFEGELRFKGQARIAGSIKGTIKGEGLLVLESTAKIEADVFVDDIILLGDFKGKLNARKSVVMEPPASFSGDVSSPSLSIKEGVFFEGNSKKTDLKS